MPRSILHNPYQIASNIVFGAKGERNMRFLAQRAGIPHSTCVAYRDNIERMPLERFAVVCESVGLSDEQIISAIKQFYRR